MRTFRNRDGNQDQGAVRDVMQLDYRVRAPQFQQILSQQPWQLLTRQLQKSNRAVQENNFHIPKLLQSMVLCALRWLEGTKAYATRMTLKYNNSISSATTKR